MSSRKYFNEVAGRWDTMRSSFFSEAVREKAYSAAGVEPGKLAADIGAGTGFITEGLLQRGLRVIVVDFSEEMLGQMKEKFKGYDCVDFRQGESENLPIQTSTVDYAMANMYLHHVEHPDLAIREMARILKPGGKAVITDMDEHNFEFLRTEQFDRWLGFRREDVKKWFLGAALKNISVDCAGCNCCADSNSSADHASISLFVAAGEK